MKKSKIPSALTSLALSALLLIPHSGAEDASALLSAMETAKANAESYESSGSLAMAYSELVRYADLAKTLADEGSVSQKEADIAAGWRDQLEYSPDIYLGIPSKDGVFFGSDGVFTVGASAVKISIPYGCYAEDYYPMIPSATGELCITVSLEITSEKTLRDIAFGKKDDYIIENLRQISRIEGRIYFAFCPSANTLRSTRTVAQSFTSAYRHVAELARRYAPNAAMLLTLADVTEPGEGTLESFYPGNGYVDALGVELCHTYNRSYDPSATAAYDCRGEYYDPVFSVSRICAEMAEIAGETLPLIVDGCSFPWEGTAAVENWEYEMERFYRLLPAVCPETVAVLYSNSSSSAGICNLRQNPDAMAVYEKCLSLPWYVDHEREDTSSPVLLTDLTWVETGEPMYLTLFCGGKFSGEEYRVFLDGSEISQNEISFTAGTHTLAVYVTNESYLSKLEYTVTVSESGSFSVSPIAPEYDLNKNGYLDFGDTETLTAYIAKWDVDIGDIDPDINGDGKVNLRDAAVLRAKMSPVQNQ